MGDQLFIPKWSEDQSVRDYKSLICNRINEVTNLPFDTDKNVPSTFACQSVMQA